MSKVPTMEIIKMLAVLVGLVVCFLIERALP
jgi:hypothetical protein